MRINVLDDIGYVELVDSMGSDLTTVNAARVSFNSDSLEFTPKDANLVNYLAKHQHTSPFRHAMLMFRFKAPIFVARQLWKHIVGITPEFDLEDNIVGLSGGFKDTGWNEMSGRYVEFVEEFHYPKTGMWRGQSSSNKQGSAGFLSEEDQAFNTQDYEDSVRHAHTAYKRMLARGTAKEQARIVLPSSLYTQWIWTGSLQAFLHVVELRAKPDAQYETQQYGFAVKDIIASRFPVALEKWLAKDNH